MKWDKQNKEKLHELIGEKMYIVAKLVPKGSPDEYTQLERHFQRFFDEFDIQYATYPSRRKNRVSIVNPWHGIKSVGGPNSGLSIPEDVALKFLVFGIP
jgi:Zn-finger nucleic acid-binding protein